MKLEHEFTVPVPVDEAWNVLLDVERVAPCMPGATIDSVDGDEFTGTVKVKVGPITVNYSGKASFTEKDEAARRVVVRARGKETRGSGTASATVTAVLGAAGDGHSTQVNVETDLAITGRPAQFGRGVMNEVGAKLLGQFADCLAGQLGAGGTAAAASASASATGEDAPASEATSQTSGGESPSGPAAESPSGPAAERPTSDTINLVEVAGGSVAKRVLPLLGLLAVAVLIWLIVRALRG